MSRTTINQLFRYGLAGGLNTIITFLAYAIMVYSGFAYQLANLLAWTLGLICGYFFNLIFVFGDKKSSPKADSRQFLKFCVMYGFSFALSTIALMGLVESGLVGPVKAQLIVIPLIVVVNFVSSKFLVFKHSAR
jgi:putative flippase GtrA